MRVLVVLEDDYRLYREMLAECLRIRRTGAEVESATPESLEEELERFDPRVIICSGHKDVKSNGGVYGSSCSWVARCQPGSAPVMEVDMSLPTPRWRGYSRSSMSSRNSHQH